MHFVCKLLMRLRNAGAANARTEICVPYGCVVVAIRRGRMCSINRHYEM